MTRPKKSNRTNLESFADLRKDFRKAFASGVLRPVDIAPRIQDMVTAATAAIFEDQKKRKMSSILSELTNGGKLNPFGTAEALTFIWVYVGTAEEVVRRNGPIVCTGDTDVLNWQLRYLFQKAVFQDKEKNLPHVAYLWRKVRQCYPPESEYPSHAKLFKLPDHPVDLDVGKTRDRIIEKFFVDMSSFPALGRNSSSTSLDDKWAVYRNAVKKKLAKTSCPEGDDKSIDTAVKPKNVEIASTSKQQRPKRGSVDSVQEIKQPAINNNNIPLKNSADNDSLLFLTNPDQTMRMNPSLFPANDVSWSARKLLSDPPRKRNKPNNPVEDASSVPEVAQTPVDCTETMLRVDFTPEEYIDQTTASNYYAQGVKIVDGVRRVVFYHKMINPFNIKKEDPI